MLHICTIYILRMLYMYVLISLLDCYITDPTRGGVYNVSTQCHQLSSIVYNCQHSSRLVVYSLLFLWELLGVY